MDYSNSQNFFEEKEFFKISEEVEKIKNVLISKTGLGNEFLGWIDLPNNYSREEINRIKSVAKKIQSDSEVLVVIGIGGSYLGTKAAIDFLYDGFYNEFSKKYKTPEIYYAGNNLSSIYLNKLIDIIGDRDFSINVVSKSGTTIEPSIAFHILKNKLYKKYGENDAIKRIYVITDEDSCLSKLDYEVFYIPRDVGGRFSILTAVGLLPIAVAGGNIDLLLEGAVQARNYALYNKFEDNDALKYAAIRNILYSKGKIIEILASYEPCLNYIAEWWKQLYGESEGKEQKGIFPVSVNMTTDLHSLGQYIQDGKRIMFETILNIENKNENIELNGIDNNFDFLNGKNMNFVNNCAMYGSIDAHVSGGVPNLIINIPEQNEYYLGELLYFFEFAVGISGYLLGVNPFNQPGVENYKKNMYKLLGKNN